MTGFCNNREERVNHYTQPGCIFKPPTEGGLDTTLQVTSVTHLVEGSHGGGSGRNDVVYEEEESVLWSQADPFPDEEVELAHCQVYTEGIKRSVM
jgi:hypothetical protein